MKYELAGINYELGDITTAEQETAMKAAFEEQAAAVLNDPDRFVKTFPREFVGLEVEQIVFSSSEPGSVRDTIVSDLRSANVELGILQIETTTNPDEDLSLLLAAIKSNDARVTSAAGELGAQILSLGIDFSAPISKIPATIQVPKYHIVPKFHRLNQASDVSTIMGVHRQDIGNTNSPGLFNAIQPNAETKGLDDAIHKLNYSLAIGPMALALFGNARYLDGQDTGIQDLRIEAWKRSHQVFTKEQLAAGSEPRTGLPRNYFLDMKDYFNRIAKHPFIQFDIDAALPIGIGEYWTDARIKVIKDSLVVEFRVMATQTTPEENFAASMFYLGRLLWSQQSQELLLDINQVRENRLQAMYLGSEAKLWSNTDRGVKLLPAQDALIIEVTRSLVALAPLLTLDLLDNVGQLLISRARGRTPSEELAHRVNTLGGLPRSDEDREEAIAMLTYALIELGAIR